MRASHQTAVTFLVLAAFACSTATSPDLETGSEAAVQSAAEDPTAAVTSEETAIAATGACPTTAGSPQPFSLTAVTQEAGLIDPLTGMHGHAVAWGDVDGNGFPDLFVGTFADRPDEKYQQRGATGPSQDRLLFGSGASFAETSPLETELGRTSGAAFVDLDNDGDLDLVASRNARPDHGPLGLETQVFRNDGGSLTLVEAGFDNSLGGRTIGVLDYNLDGLLDLFIVEDRYRGGSSRLFRNEGDLTFTDVTAEAGIPLDVNGLGVAIGNLAGDARADIFVSGSNRLLIASGDTFTERETSVFDWETFGNEDIIAGVDIADVDLDGRLDLVVGHHYNSTVDFDTEVAVRLYLNRSQGDNAAFIDVTNEAGLSPLPTKAPHVEFADMNNDGLLDIVTSASADNGSTPAIFMGNGFSDGVPTFETPAGLGSDQYWVSAPTVDFNRDGRLDVFLVEWEPSLPSLLFAGAAEGNWLTVGLNEVSLAPGADVAVYVGGELGEADALIGHREITTSRGYSAGSEPMVHFGIGTIDAVDVLVTLRDGSAFTAEGVAANAFYLLPDGCG